ncbi:unnamed protein product [Linum tenue]|uniref:Protein kinase domain-containing protein n=1 Tax=Linum tenue TaxID=586396 RepID=A0AAV0GWG2_9ROSI|nr:unnamed protein product [Linum tenue]
MALAATPPHTSLFFLLHLCLLLPPAAAITFQKKNFDPNDASILYCGGARASSGTVKLTSAHYGIEDSHVTYAEDVPLWSSATGELSDFNTRFSFSIDAESAYPSGIAFFLAPLGFQPPENSAGGYMGLYNYTDRVHPPAGKQLVHVEFDCFLNGWDPPFRHVGINNNSLASMVVAPWNSSSPPGGTVMVDINYTASTHNLTVVWECENGSNSSLWYVIDLREVLPEWVRIGFSATNNDYSGEQELLSWDFYSDLQMKNTDRERNSVNRKLIGIVLVLAGIAIAAKLAAFVFLQVRRKRGRAHKGMNSLSMTDEFSRCSGPRKFTHTDLVSATNNFSPDRKLGEGGSGAVYRGCLRDYSDTAVAVKRISRDSKQGIKEYTTEVMIISRLRHRNIVPLIGWCHEKGELLLVYQFMPKGSLDSHLFGENTPLLWPQRYSIAMGLASSLLYLHEEWEQCVVHRDIKAANVMLDSGFNVKLGDFGLARLIDHELRPRTTKLAGTIGYMSPEYISTGRASKESDVYSFGVVCLEIATGRRVVDYIEDGLEMSLVEWVWELYGNGNHSVAIDKRLVDFDEREVECLIVVGLWCAHPDSCQRASIRQAIQVLKFELPFPCLPEKRPFPVFHVHRPAESEGSDEPLLSHSSTECDSS